VRAAFVGRQAKRLKAKVCSGAEIQLGPKDTAMCLQGFAVEVPKSSSKNNYFEALNEIDWKRK